MKRRSNQVEKARPDGPSKYQRKLLTNRGSLGSALAEAMEQHKLNGEARGRFQQRAIGER
jgi:hypothetical protein